jgi:hypothetical protein
MDSDNNLLYNLLIFIFSFSVGFLIGYFLFKDVKYIGPNSNEIVKNIYIDEHGKKYKYKPQITICPSKYSMNKLHNQNFKETH